MPFLAYKTQVEGPKKELENQEQSYREQMTTQGQNAHENLVATHLLIASKENGPAIRSYMLQTKYVSKHGGTSNG